MRRGYYSTFCRIWQDKRAAPKGGGILPSPLPPPLGEVPPQGAERVSPAKKKSPGGGLGIDFFPYHVILKIKRGAAGRREPLSSYRVTAERPSLWRLLLFYLENQRNDGYDQNTEVKEIGIRDHDITPLRCSGGGKEVSASSRKRGLPPTEYWQRQRISMRRGYYSMFCRIWQGVGSAPKGGGILPSRAAPVPPPFNKGGYWCRKTAPLVKGGTPPKAEGGFRPPVLSLRGGAKPRRGNPSPRPPCLPIWGRCPRRGRRALPGKKKSPGGGLGIDFFPYHVILKIKRGVAGRREPLNSYEIVTV